MLLFWYWNLHVEDKVNKVVVGKWPLDIWNNAMIYLSDNQTIASKFTIPNAQSISHLSVVQSIDFKSAPSWNVTIVYLYQSFPSSTGSRSQRSQRFATLGSFLPRGFVVSWFRGLIWNLSCFFVNSTNFKARSIFSFLNLSYIKEWSGKYSPFLELLRRLMSKRHILSYQVLVAQILKMKLLNQMKWVVFGTNELKRVILLNQK